MLETGIRFLGVLDREHRSRGPTISFSGKKHFSKSQFRHVVKF